jgi:dihydropteroate synthase
MKYFPRAIEIKGKDQATEELRLIGVHLDGLKIMSAKGVFRAVKVIGLKPVAANILKQEMLSYGGEVAVCHGAIDLSVKKTDAIIFGTERQFEELTQKLAQHQFDLPVLALEIRGSLKRYAMPPKPIRVGNLKMEFGKRTYIMGVLNVTPDSFSDGGRHFSLEDALRSALEMEGEGADIIDIGGQSTRPGAKKIGAKEELDRVIPVIRGLKRKLKVPMSIDTTRASVAGEALKAGAFMINDISALRFDRGIAKVAAKFNVPIVLMHMQGTPRTMQKDPKYHDLMGEILEYLQEGVRIAVKAGVKEDKIIIDPGIGFGKTVGHNLKIIKRLSELKCLGRPIMIGPSRKSFIGKTLDLPVEERLEGTAAAVAASIASGADIVRVHDVLAMKRTALMTDAILRKDL